MAQPASRRRRRPREDPLPIRAALSPTWAPPPGDLRVFSRSGRARTPARLQPRDDSAAAHRRPIPSVDTWEDLKAPGRHDPAWASSEHRRFAGISAPSPTFSARSEPWPRRRRRSRSSRPSPSSSSAARAWPRRRWPALPAGLVSSRKQVALGPLRQPHRVSRDGDQRPRRRA